MDNWTIFLVAISSKGDKLFSIDYYCPTNLQYCSHHPKLRAKVFIFSHILVFSHAWRIVLRNKKRVASKIRYILRGSIDDYDSYHYQSSLLRHWLYDFQENINHLQYIIKANTISFNPYISRNIGKNFVFLFKNWKLYYYKLRNTMKIFLGVNTFLWYICLALL